jgi:bifunctional DNA-binding transcriptional regulator/antitoxin component of YhaV-PrlF toxin-antitoxin module
MLICKLLNIGNTIGVTVPAAYRRLLNWRRGDHVSMKLIVNEDGKAIELRIWSIEHASQQPETNPGKTTLTKAGR